MLTCCYFNVAYLLQTCYYSVATEPVIDYIYHHCIYADLPLDYIMEKMTGYYDERCQIWFGDEMEALRSKYDGARMDQNKQ